MKRVIDGKLYNTDTATALHGWDNELGENDHTNCETTLYRTRNGNYFVSGSGGPASRWAESCGRTATCSGEGLEALSPEDALEWAERHGMDADDIAAEFAAAVTEA